MTDNVCRLSALIDEIRTRPLGNVNGKLRDIVSGEMDKLYDLAKPKFKRVRAIIRQIQRSN